MTSYQFSKDQVICCYGARKLASEFFERNNITIAYYIDDNEKLWNTVYRGIKVITLKEAMEKYGDRLQIIITNYYLNSVCRRLDKSGISCEQVHFIPEALIEDLDTEQTAKHKKSIEKIFGQLCDFKSKMIYKALFESRMDKNLEIFGLLRDEIQYFPEEIFQYKDNEVLVDGGAFTGDTIEIFQEFLKKKGKNLAAVYAFEPDDENYNTIKGKNFEKNMKTYIYKAGMHSSNTQLCFDGGWDNRSMVVEDSSQRIDVLAADSIDIVEEPTLLKMDIEGCELEALKGSANLIKKYKPKLAICIYHKLEDLWEIPEYIKQLVPEYRFYIRNYTNAMDEVVLYATIDE